MPDRHHELLPGNQMKKRLFIFIPVVLLVIAVLAIPLRSVVHDWILLPLARFFWLVRGYYGALPQFAYWIAALGIAFLIVLLSIHIPGWEKRGQPTRVGLKPGSISEMSFWIRRGKRNLFPKWHIAQVLAGIAIEILDGRRVKQAPIRSLKGQNWTPPEEVKNYLESALTTNYSDLPKPGPFRPNQPTPFDQDLDPVIDYLESLLENENDHNS
jgi:hypothetical protein